MTSLKTSKYASMSIKKTFNNSFWRNVIYDFDCSDFLIYDLEQFVNEITFAHEMIDTSNESMMIEEYETMLVNNKINEKDWRIFFDNIVYVSSINVILMFVTRLKKQKYVWNMYKKTLMNKTFETMICDIKKRHELFFLKYRFVEKFVNAMQSHKKTIAKTTFWNWHLWLNHYRSEIINHLKKIDEMKITQKKTSKIVQCNIYAVFKMHRLIQKNRQQKQQSFF